MDPVTLATIVARLPFSLLVEQAKGALAKQPAKRSRLQRTRIATVTAVQKFQITYGAVTTVLATGIGLYVGLRVAQGTDIAKVLFGALAALGGYLAVPLVIFLVCWLAILFGAKLGGEPVGTLLVNAPKPDRG
jgi:uncharacterized membrane protein YfcA